MGGKMNLNPLKKDDNTDALVKALEDANNTGDPSVGLPQDPATQQDQGVMPTGLADSPVDTASSDAASQQIATDTSFAADPAVTDQASDVDTSATSTDPTSELTFDGTSELPIGLSSDANAHIPSDSTSSSSDGELDGVKRSALEQLRPLIEKLDLEPADKFDKYLMMLRASDDPALIKPAFDAAQGITGEKEKAQALLDIINEINYITANQQQ